jgi:RNA polymerase-binding protein DksA
VALDLERIRAGLETERDRLRAAMNAVNHERSLEDETGDLSIGSDDHIADTATETFMRELDVGLEENAVRMLADIETALRRLDDGSYGTCVVCGKPIADERLQAVPWATLCIDDKRAQERGSVRPETAR